ncbi:DUF4012 domain-containing protein [Microbacterium sp.]|uniref:DUF4012 domain-containing protein n=1 Tax=Microbacterium sp. TaxID=51671 RepID=UPI003562B191
MTTRAELRAEKTRRPLLRSFRFWVPVGILLLLLVLAVVSGVVGKRLYDQAMDVRGHLVNAVAEVKEVQRAITAGDLESASTASDRLTAQTEAAVAGSSGRLWTFASSTPFIGGNLTAVRQIAVTTNQLASDVVAPASTISLEAFRPQEGRINLEAITGIAALIDQIETGIDDAVVSLERIDRGGLVDQVASGLDQLDGALAEVQPMIQPVRDIVEVLPNALGADGPRNYLLMFQGNSEARSLGGNAAIFIVLRAENGGLSIVDEIASQQFHNAPSTPVTELDPEAVNIYGDKIGRYTADFTMVPDFPEAVRILSAWWEREGFTPFDAVLSFDPVALSYLLSATGPVQLPTGDALSSDNAVSLLLNEAYFRYSDPIEQNVFFGAAASGVFNAVTSGTFDAVKFVAALTRAADEGRLLYWSTNERETELIQGSRMQGALPSDNKDQSVLGVYVNDNTGSKMSYYLDLSVATCRTGDRVTAEATLASSITAEQAAGLPPYISGQYFTPGDISTYVVLYGPIGTSVTDVTIDGAPAQILASGSHLGRPAVKVEIFNSLVSSHTIAVNFDGLGTDSGVVDVWHTPMVHETSVALDGSCAP